MIEVVSVAVVALDDASPLMEPRDGDKGVGVVPGGSDGLPLIDPAFELAALAAALVPDPQV